MPTAKRSVRENINFKVSAHLDSNKDLLEDWPDHEEENVTEGDTKINELYVVLEAISKAEPEVVDDVSPQETDEEEFDLDVNLKDDLKLSYNSEIDVHESLIDDKVETRY